MGWWPSGFTFKRKTWPALISGGLAFSLYLRSLAPGVLSYDFAEFQYLPARLGLPHPNGFPFYMLLGWLWSRFPADNLALWMNLLSAVTGAITVAVFSLLLKELTGRNDIALAGSFFLALMPSFRFYSSGAERYTLLMLLFLASFLEGLRWDRMGQFRALILSSLFMGLALATHPAAFPALPFWFFYVAFSRPRQFFSRSSLLAGIAFFLPLTLYLYVPWRWVALARYPLIPELGVSEAIYRGLTFAWYRPELSPRLVWEYIFGLGNYSFGFIRGGWKEALLSLGSIKHFLFTEFPLPLWPLAFVGSLWLLMRQPKLWLSLTGIASFDLLFTVYVRLGKPEAYLFPAFGVFALWLSLGLGAFAKAWEKLWFPKAMAWGLMVLLLWGFYLSAIPATTIHRFSGIESWWREVLSYPLENGSALMAHWGDLAPFWYFQQAENLRPDLLGLYPPESNIASRWLSGGKALYLAGPTHGFDPDFPAGFKLMPWGKLLRILPPEFNPSCPEGLTPASEISGWPVKIKGWRFSKNKKLLELCWEASESFPASLHLSVRVLSSTGSPIYQKEEPLLPSWYPYPEVRAGEKGLFMAYLELPEGVPPGNYKVELALFALKGENWEPIGLSPYSLGEISPVHPLIWRAKGDRVLLLRPQAGPFRVVAFRTSEKPVRPGDPVRLEIVWEAVESPEADYLVAFRMRDIKGVVKVSKPQPLSPDFPTARWSKGEKFRVIYGLQAPRRLSGRAFWVEPVILSPEGEEKWKGLRFHAGPFFVRARHHLRELPKGAIPVGIRFGEIAELAGYILEEGRDLKLILYWRVLGETENSYKVFTHLVNETGQIVTQHDSIPSEGAHPTNIWVKGEIIEDPHTLRGDLPPGKYTILVGLYDPITMERLKVDAPDNAFPLVAIEK
ncbi:MAG: DUF2723 domain-containing protein [Anaerolineae bacterium]|nr:DUF2723 domain-containing protein [Anaerolineae bacterium]